MTFTQITLLCSSNQSLNRENDRKQNPTINQNKLDKVSTASSVVKYSFSLLLKQLWVFCKEPPPPFMSPRWIRFWPWDYITDSLFQYRTTEAMNRTHSWRTQTLFSSTTAQMYHFFISGEPRQLRPKSPARIGLPDRVPLHSDNRHVIGLHLRLSNPAAGAAEWLHYTSDGPDQRVNGKCVYRSLRATSFRLCSR